MTDQLPNRSGDRRGADDPAVAAYAVTGLRYGNQVPLTYSFADFSIGDVRPLDFPFGRTVGAIHHRPSRATGDCGH